MDAPLYFFALFATFAFILGAIVGSFLNVVIYRLPLGLSVNDPKRSFCPHCKTQIPIHQNIPLFSWFFLRGKCARCGAPIAFRYFGVELLTAILFLLLWLKCAQADAWSLALPLWVFTGVLIAATFIDFDHFIIPDELTLGGTVAGLVFSFGLPSLMGVESHWMGLLWSSVGAATGYGLLWGVVELGKLAFGRRKETFDPPAPFEWKRKEDDAEFKVGDDTVLWSEIFARESDQLILETEGLRIDGKALGEGGPTTLRLYYNRLIEPGAEACERMLDSLDSLSGNIRSMVIPREAMGFGDVKFIACIGAFLGWKAVLFTIFAASIVGSVAGVAQLLLKRRANATPIPFGPYLALGALAWIFFGPELVAWYWLRLQ